MKIKSKIFSKLLVALCSTMIVFNVHAQDIPKVYDQENTGADFPKPPLPKMSEAKLVRPLPDPFLWADDSGRDTTFAAWEHHRNDFKAEIENYEIGIKPDRPDSIEANFNWADSILTVNVIKNGDTATITSRVTVPNTDGPYPAIIGVGFGGSGSLPSSIFTSRNIAMIAFNQSQVSTYGGARVDDPFFRLYPDQNPVNTGQYAAWSWGISRVIDGLELVQDTLHIDLKHLAVTGCSYAGKMALFAGAFDERIALTIAQESGGGGAPAWRVSETLAGVETLSATDHSWFKDDMFAYGGTNTSFLPHDHHELMAMCAPRALLVTGNEDFLWLANPSCYVSSRAAQRIYNTLGIGDRFGFYIDGGHGHCQVPDAEVPYIEKFVDKFLLDIDTVETNVEVNPYPDINYKRWTQWWGTDDPAFPEQYIGETVTLEAECGSIGADWEKIGDSNASNHAYVVSKDVGNITNKDDINTNSSIEYTFSVDTNANFSLFARTNCPTSSNDSYWFKVDTNNYYMKMGLVTDGWEWKTLGNFDLTKGSHTLYISYRETGAMLDKLCITSLMYYEPSGMEQDAANLCEPNVGINDKAADTGYSLGQNFPNPFTKNTSISFTIPKETYVSLKVYSVLGKEIAELAGKDFKAGKHTVDFNSKDLSNGLYFFTIKADEFSQTRKMYLQNK